MQGNFSHELEVRVPASIVWETYRGLELGRLVPKLIPFLLEKVVVIEGDGGEGTIVEVTFRQETPGFRYYKEKFVKIDDEKRVKVTEMIEGGFLLLGFSSYRNRSEIIEKDATTSIIRSSIEYEIREDATVDPSMLSTKPLELAAEAVGNYLELKHGTAATDAA